MQGRAISFFVGFLMAALFAIAALSQETRSSLCVNGYPAKRSTHVTYGHLRPMPGCARDHIVPLCLGGPDTLDNLQYQPLYESYLKDEEERMACEDYCAGRISLWEARSRGPVGHHGPSPFQREYPNTLCMRQ